MVRSMMYTKKKSNSYVLSNEGLWDKIVKVFSDARAAINARGMRKKYDKMLEDLKNGKSLKMKLRNSLMTIEIGS